MPAHRLPWVKLWVESCDHEKVALLPDADYRTWTLLLLLGSQQPKRWRFASVQHAAIVVGRPAEQVDALVARGLLDIKDDGLWIHDWKQWQDRSPSDFLPRAEADDAVDSPSMNSETLRERSAKAPPLIPEDSLRARKEGRGEKGDERLTTNPVIVGMSLAPDAVAPDAPDPMPGTELAKATPTKTRARDPVWDALDTIFGPPRTKVEHGKRNAACKQFRDAHATVEEIDSGHEHWPEVMGSATETPMGLAANLGLLLGGPQVNGRSNGTVTQHTQRLTEYAAVNRGPKRGAAAIEGDGWTLSGGHEGTKTDGH